MYRSFPEHPELDTPGGSFYEIRMFFEEKNCLIFIKHKFWRVGGGELDSVGGGNPGWRG